MPTHPTSLGGRLPLFDRDSLTPAQEKLYDHMMVNVVPSADAAGFMARTDDGQLIGPFNPALLKPAAASVFLKLQYTEETQTSLSERTRQVVILTVGAVWQASYELYAHSAVGRRAGLSDDAVRTLAAGGLPEDLTDEEIAAHRIARLLSVEHRLDDAQYGEAEALFGAQGVFDIVILVGIYHTVCAILNAFAIPAA
jgi:4-carboxymuconolactone decarboxylase